MPNNHCLSAVFSFLFVTFFLCNRSVIYCQNKLPIHTPNSTRFDNLPHGTITKYEWVSKIYPNTKRDYYLYIPAQYKPDDTAALMVFQDGHAYLKEDGDYRATIVMDNLIAQAKMPVTIGLFVNPGHHIDSLPPSSPFRVSNRSVEYDEVSNRYGRMLLEEIIPEVSKNFKISNDPKMRAICGLSSGGIAAFSTAWFHPQSFHKVMSHIGSFTDIRGGHAYPSLIRKADKKDLKIYLQDGDMDLDNQYGNWWLANLQMEAALKYKSYDFRFDKGHTGHDAKHAGPLFPSALEWLWKEEVDSLIYSTAFVSKLNEGIIYKGESLHFSSAKLLKKVINHSTSIDPTNNEYEQMIFVQSGEVFIKKGDKDYKLGANSICQINRGENTRILGLGDKQSTLFIMQYVSKKPEVKSQYKDVVIDFDTIKFNPHARGGVRNYFRTSTPMCDYYEMHMTDLYPRIKSHEPHIHSAEELIIMIEGDTEMEIGNEIVRARKGDVYYLGGNVPHAIKNLGDKPARYLAFQWTD